MKRHFLSSILVITILLSTLPIHIFAVNRKRKIIYVVEDRSPFLHEGSGVRS